MKSVPYELKLLSENEKYYDDKVIMPYLIRAYSKLQVYKALIKESQVSSRYFLPAIQTKEALASSAIEGTQATIEDVYESRIENTYQNRDLQEITNCYKAIGYGFSYLQGNHMDIEFFNELNSYMLQGEVHKDSERKGELRTKQNVVKNKKTGQTTYMPPRPEAVEPGMYNLINYIECSDTDYNELIRIAIIHAQFETIHPYSDGNGRVGRILVPLYLYYKKVIPNPYFFISDILENNRTKYYNLLNKLRESGAWDEWILFFLESIDKQCDKYIMMIHEINKLYRRDLERITTLLNPTKGKQLLDLLFKYPAINTNIVMKNMTLTRNTALKYLQTLEEERILYSNGQERYVYFYYDELLSLL